MKTKNLFFFPLLLLSLTLAGCKGDNSTPSSENPTTSETIDLSAEEEGLVEMGYTAVRGWPQAEINEFLTGFKVSGTIPALSLSGNSFIYAFYGDEEYYPSLELFIPSTDRSAEYETAANSAGYDVSFSDEYGSYQAWDVTETIVIEFFYEGAVDGYPAGMSFFINLLTDEVFDGETGGGGEVTEPTNPDTASTFSFADISQITGGKNADATTWTANGTTLKVEKGESTVPVGNYGVAANNGGEGYFDVDGALRIYALQVVTITAASGSLIEQLEFTGLEGHAATVGNITGSAPSSVSTSVSGDVVMFSLNTAAASISFVASAQFRITSLVVYFA